MCLALAQTHRSLMVFTNAVVWPQPTLPPPFGCRVWIRYALCMDQMIFYKNCVCSGFILLVMSLQLSWGICVTVLDVAFFVPLVLYSPAVSYSNCEEIAKKGLDCSEVGGIVGMECVHFWLVWLAECVSWTTGFTSLVWGVLQRRHTRPWCALLLVQTFGVLLSLRR